MQGIEILEKKKLPSPTAYLNGYLNIVMFYFGFLASQKIKDENDSLE
jgi:hypothetical protein